MKKISMFIVLLAVSIMSLVSCGSKETNNDLPIALQLYTVRQDMKNDFKGTLQKVKDMGYDGVEFAGLFDNSPEDVKAMCEEIGLIPISAHVPLADMLADVDKVISDYKTIGCEYIVVPYVTKERRPDGELFMQMVEEIRSIGEKVKEAGLVLLYHNHDFEFKKLESGEYGLDYLFTNVPADLLQTELDLCWVRYAGLDPVEYLKKYTGRAPVVHFKDYYVEGEQGDDPYALIGLNENTKKDNKTFEYRPLGYGVQNIPSLLQAAKEVGSKWIVVEQDRPSMDKTTIESAAMSIEYLKKVMNGEDCCAECTTPCEEKTE